MKIYLSSKAVKQLRKLPRSIHNLTLNRIEKLSEDPFFPGSRKLSGREGWRIRIGDYRILYTVNIRKKETTILSIVHRRDAYKF